MTGPGKNIKKKYLNHLSKYALVKHPFHMTKEWNIFYY